MAECEASRLAAARLAANLPVDELPDAGRRFFWPIEHCPYIVLAFFS